MELTRLINHPDEMDRDTLYELRSLLALYPYFQTARLLMLQNLYLLHDPTFDEELRRASIYITDRKVLFRLIEAAHYKLQPQKKASEAAPKDNDSKDSRTISLIDSFLDSIPKDEQPADKKQKRKPTPADAAVDYVSYLLETETEDDGKQGTAAQPQMKGQELIDDFINNDKGKIELKEEPEYVPESNDTKDSENMVDGSYCTETLARIYIQQGRFEKALEIITRLNLIFPKKNANFADQKRFLKKL